MNLKKKGIKYIDVGILILLQIYQDEKGELDLFDSWEKKREMEEKEELETLFKIDKKMLNEIEGKIYFENETYLGIKN